MKSLEIVFAFITEGFLDWLKKRSKEEFAYLFGIVSGTIILLVSGVFNIDKSITSNLLSYSSLAFIYGFGSYLIPEIIYASNSIIGKIVVTATLVLGTAITHSFSAQIINMALEVPSSPFIHTQTILTVLSAPLVFAISFAFLGMFFIFLLFVNFKKATNEPLLLMIRMIIYISLWGVSINTLNSYSDVYTEKLGGIAKLSAWHLESESYSFCEKQVNERISYIDSQNIIISSNNNGKYTFKTGTCVNKK